jgi:hypothetical protein
MKRVATPIQQASHGQEGLAEPLSSLFCPKSPDYVIEADPVDC